MMKPRFLRRIEFLQRPLQLAPLIQVLDLPRHAKLRHPRHHHQVPARAGDIASSASAPWCRSLPWSPARSLPARAAGTAESAAARAAASCGRPSPSASCARRRVSSPFIVIDEFVILGKIGVVGRTKIRPLPGLGLVFGLGRFLLWGCMGKPRTFRGPAVRLLGRFEGEEAIDSSEATADPPVSPTASESPRGSCTSCADEKSPADAPIFGLA